MSNQEQTESFKRYAVEVMRGLGMQRNSQNFCDLTVVIDDNVEFKCHRVVLAASSEFFNALLSSGMKEDLERRVNLKGISAETFSEVLECIYECKYILTDKNVLNVWHAANQLSITFLLEDCKTFVTQIISVDNCFAIYQTSKLLDSVEITKFSWNYILRNFEEVRKCDEILMLTASEMKLLVGSQDLVTISEDRVLKTILKWAAYTPEEETPESLVCTTESFTQNTRVEKNSSPSPETEENGDPRLDSAGLQQQQRDEQPATDNQTEKQQQHSEAQGLGTASFAEEDDKHTSGTPFSRENSLSDLLNASRISLVSGRCMMEMLWMNPMIRANEKALDVVQEATGYQVQADRRHDYCPPSAVHRTSSAMENVIAAIQGDTSSDIIVCRRQNGKWYGLGKRHKVYEDGEEDDEGDVVDAYSAVCFDHNIYVALSGQRLDLYISSTNQWKALPSVTVQESGAHMLALGNNLYAVHNDGNHSIDMLNIKDALDGQVQGHWLKTGTLSTAGLIISCVTTVADKIVVFGNKDGANDTIVECFDTTTLTSMRLDDIPGPSPGMVSFRKGTNTFILQKSGALWRIKSCPDPPFVEVKYETLLWDFYRDLKGAVLFKDELLLFGPSIPSNDMDKQWELAVPGVFERVQNIPCRENYSCFMNIVVPKKSLIKPLQSETARSASLQTSGARRT